ncbi:MAG: hypothetical protein Q9168_002530 [Polycauliona sp. 1 TL-2023]
MKGRKVLPIAAAGILITHKASCHQPQIQDFPFPPDVAHGSSNPNETLYGPLKVIELPGGTSHPTKFVPYPDIDPEVRKGIANGGLGIICSSCNATGCICPESIPDLSSVCDFCRGTKDGGLRCYCSPALFASACNTISGEHISSCDGMHELCTKMPAVFFCEAQPWYQDPRLQNLTASVVVYDFKELTMTPDADVAMWAQRGMDQERVIGPGNYSNGAEGDDVWKSLNKPSEMVSRGSRNVVGAGVAAAAVAGGFAFLMGP